MSRPCKQSCQFICYFHKVRHHHLLVWSCSDILNNLSLRPSNIAWFTSTNWGVCPSTVRKKLDIIHRENEQVLNNHQLILLDSLPQEVCLKSDFAGCSTLSSFRLRKKLMTLSTECAFSGGQKNPRTEGRNKEDLREWKNLDNSSRQGYDQQGLSANLQRNDDPKIQSI